jgi:flagella synthesis protein FlgN
MEQTLSYNPMESLREEHMALAELVALMKTEQAHLISADIEGLQEINDKKAKIVARISDMAQKRHRALACAGFAPKEENMKAWLASINQDNVGQAWDQLLSITRSAKEINRVNGMLINKQLMFNQNAINALQAPAQNAAAGKFYGANGQTTNITSTRRLVVG